MLHCDLCDYYKTTHTKGKSNAKCMCELTGFVFHKKVEEYDFENHPCYEYDVKANAVNQELNVRISA